MLNVRSTCLVLGLSLAGLAASVPLSAQTAAPADQTTQASAAAPQDQGGGSAPAAQPAPAAQAAAPAAPQPLASPTMTAPLQTAAPAHTFNAGPFGNISVTGILSGIAMAQSDPFAGDRPAHWDISNAQVFIQKTTGWWQFYLQGGAYNLPDLGTPYIRTVDTLGEFYGALPVAYLKFVKGNFNVEAGELPTLIGAEYTFSFENMNIERGLLWNQENAVNRGVQVSDTFKKLSLTASWNDGFYSDVFNWITGTAAYAFNASNTLSFVGGGNVGHTSYSSAATPFLQNNGAIYEVLYTYSHGNWMITPYWQYTDVPTDTKLGILRSGSTDGGAVLLNYNFKHGVSLAVRPEYIGSSGLNLLGYGSGSGAFAFTITPTYQKGGFFVRGDFAIVDATSATKGDAFGYYGTDSTQTRGMIESGFLF